MIKIEPEPLKNKLEYVDDFELKAEEFCHPATIQGVYTEEDVKAAVEWLKQRMADKIIQTGDDCLINEWIDEAFHDVTHTPQDTSPHKP